MKYVLQLTLSVILLTLLSACTAISEEECRLGDWYQIGLKDGQAGNKNNAATYNKECSEFKVKVEPELYNQGRSEGLKSFCSYENGVVQGASGNSYNHVCPASLAQAFLSGYTPHYNLSKAQNALAESETKIAALKSQLTDEQLTSEGKKDLKSRLKSAKNRYERAASEVRKQELALELHKTNREIEQIRMQLDGGELSALRSELLQKRQAKLLEKRDYIENLAQTNNTILTIKDLAEMF